MLRTNSKTTKAKIRDYILKGSQDCDYINGATFEEVAPQIARAFYKQILGENTQGQDILFCYYKNNVFNAFFDWCGGLPSAIDCDYLYNVSAIDLLGDILEQTKEQRGKYTERESEKVLTMLIYRELEKFIFNEIVSHR